MGFFDGLPVPPDKEYLRDELSRIDESWATARFDSLPHVVHILTSKDREGEVQILKEQSDVVEEVVDEVVHAYHGGFNKAIQNYSQILRLFSESAESIGTLKVDLSEAKKRLGTRNKQLHQLWYRSVTLRHIISLLDQIEGIAKVPSRIEKLIAEKQYYAAVQLHVQSTLMLEREGLQTVGALQDVRSELTKLRGTLFYKVFEDLHAHLYNNGEYSSVASSMNERDDALPTTTAVAFTMSNSQSLSRRTRLMKGDNHGFMDGSYRLSSADGGSSFDGHDEEGTLESHDESNLNGHSATMRVNGGDGNTKDSKVVPHQVPHWLSNSTPDEFVETIKKSDALLHVKYLLTMVECLCMLGKVAAAGAMICQRLRPTVHDIITSKIKSHAELVNSSKSSICQAVQTAATGLHIMKGQLESYQLSKQKPQNGISLAVTLLSVSPVSPVMAPAGKAQAAAKDLLSSILDTVVQIFENHVVVGELLESKSTQNADMNTAQSMIDVNWNPDSEASQVAGGFSIGSSMSVLQSECQQLICEILRATPEAASADAAVQTARLASKAPSKEKKDGSEDGLTFAFRFTDASISIPNQGVDLIRQGWNRRGPNVLQEGYGSAAVLPEQGIYLAASVYRPVLEFTDKVASLLPKKYSQLGNDGLLAFVENFVKDHFLPTMFVDYRKGVQQAISSPAAFRPRAHAAASYTSSIEKGRPVLQGLLAIDFLAKEVLGWAQAMPKFSSDLVKYVQTFLERAYERCRTSYMEAVLEKQSYMLIGRHDIEKLMRLDPASSCLPNPPSKANVNNTSGSESAEVESELSELLLNLRPIRQENLIRDDNKLILLASLSDSLEYVADSIERLTLRRSSQAEVKGKDLASFSDDYRKLAVDCLKVLRVEMQLETIFHMQEMSNREYLEDQDAEEPDDFIISLTAQITRRDEEIAPFVAGVKRNYIFGGICGIAANASIKALADMKAINLFGVQQICRNSIALEQALAAIPSIDSEAVQQRLDHARTYYELLNMPFEVW
ncbi:exocyst complex component SEC8 isoform X3 [Manihot esculenta]|uniref:exocyst complex component SEC8 isoform X3 n=1 Tax=Manihot esculenta TaxID=3983 RepID=UPI000B5D3A74|nr:exocyst complex component SEC8 isoform X3 [Manihot esculenta]